MSAPYKLVLDDGNRNLSRRPGQTSDCSVRALAIITQSTYDDVYDLLAKAGRKPCQGFHLDDWLKARRGRVLGGRFKAVKIRFADSNVSPRFTETLTPTTFPLRYPTGRYLVSTANHVYCVVNGVAHDLWRVKEQPLVDAWQWHSNKEA